MNRPPFYDSLPRELLFQYGFGGHGSNASSTSGSTSSSTSSSPTSGSVGTLSDTSPSSDSLRLDGFMLHSSDNIHSHEALPTNPGQLTFEEVFNQQQLHQQLQHQLPTGVSSALKHSPPNHSDSSDGIIRPHFETITKSSATTSTTTTTTTTKIDTPPLIHPQALAKWGEYQKPNEEILGQIISKKMNEKEEYIDVAPFVTFPQHEAARRLGIPSSTLSKKWKDATINRKWPYRALAKIDKEITTIMHNIPKNSDGTLDPELEEQLAVLLRKRQGEARAVIIRMT